MVLLTVTGKGERGGERMERYMQNNGREGEREGRDTCKIMGRARMQEKRDTCKIERRKIDVK